MEFLKKWKYMSSKHKSKLEFILIKIYFHSYVTYSSLNLLTMWNKKLNNYLNIRFFVKIICLKKNIWTKVLMKNLKMLQTFERTQQFQIVNIFAKKNKIIEKSLVKKIIWTQVLEKYLKIILIERTQLCSTKFNTLSAK